MKTKIVFAIIIIATIFASCNRQAPKEYECKLYSAECELQKNNILFIPIEFDSNVVDIYGFPIGEVTQRWHFSNKVAGGVVPILVNSVSGYYPTTEALLESWDTRMQHILIDTADISGRIPGIKKAALVLTGKNEIIPMYISNQGMGAMIASAKK